MGTACTRAGWSRGGLGRCSGQCDMGQAWSVQIRCSGTSVWRHEASRGLQAQLVSGEAALTGASEVENPSLIPLWLRCHFPNLPLPLACLEKAQLRPASFSSEGICLSPQAAEPRSRLPSVYSWVFSFQGPLGLWSCVNAWGRGWGTLGSGGCWNVSGSLSASCS